MLGHDSAETHVTGKSEFIDDRPMLSNEVFCYPVYSSEAKADIEKLDISAALKHDGVLAVFTAADIIHNRWGTIFQDQPLLAEKEVNYVGEVLAVVAATKRLAALEAAHKVEVTYKTKSPILSIDQAKSGGSFIGEERQIIRGDFQKHFASSIHKIEGEIVIRGQDHFYLESQAVVVYPKEDGQLEVHSSTQHPTEVQHVIAHCLGLASKDIVVIVKRMGGAFGGKESQAAPFAALTALVAKKLGRAARMILTKDDDMILTGKRNPFQNHYRVGFDDKGQIQALAAELFSDGGAYADLSTAIMERAMLHCDNAYYLPHVSIRGRVCRTNFHPHTAFRGFGGPKGVATIEKIIEQIAQMLKLDALDVRKANIYRDVGEKNITPYGQKFENNLLAPLFETIETTSDYRNRRRLIRAHNDKQNDTVRGLSVTAVKFGISFTTRFLNQGNALVVIHRDGTVQISTGATEMGQGANARIATVVANELGLDRSLVRVLPTSTDKNANTSPTAASTGTDLNAGAAILAVRKIKSRLSQLAAQVLALPDKNWAKLTAGLGTQPEIEIDQYRYQAVHPNEGADFESGLQTFDGIQFENGKVFHSKDLKRTISFSELTNEAYLNRISLSDYAHYRFPGLTFNKLTGQGRAFLYYTQGVAASEVEIDRTTGEVKISRVDILMDLGKPIHEELDLGQIYGGFIQGMGWVTTEKLYYDNKGKPLSHSPSTYKIPNIQDTPRIFNVALFPNPGNKVNINGTKAVGEPPLLLGISAWTAILDALSSTDIELPATQEQVLRALYPKRFHELEQFS